MVIGLLIKFLWSDIDVIEIRISASNGEFSGTADAYIGWDGLAQAASVLAGFPNSINDVRELTLGTMDPGFASGGASMRFFCKDSSGHAVAEVVISSEDERLTHGWSRPAQSAHFFAHIEANAVDEFVRELSAFDPHDSGVASLAFTEP